MKAYLLLLALLVGSASGAEFVVTSFRNGVATNYPLQPPVGSFVEVVQVSSLTNSHKAWPLKVTFTDGRFTNEFEVRDSRSPGVKMVGISSIQPLASNDHTILWKITPAAEFGANGATYHTLLGPSPGSNTGSHFTVPASSQVKVLQGTSPATTVSLFSSEPGLTAEITELRVPSQENPFIAAIENVSGDVLLLEITPAPSTTNPVVTIQQSDNLQQWETLHTFEILPGRLKQFFRATITTPAE